MRTLRLAAFASAGVVGLSLLATPAIAADRSQPEKVHVTSTAHRGASAYAPENTLAAFEVGIDQKATWIESDVQLTSDGEPVLIHDTTLTRTTDAEEVFPDRAPWNVGDFTLAEIKQLDAGSWFGPEFAGEEVPTLAEMVTEVRSSRSGILMELKSPELYPGVEEVVADTFDSFPGYLRSALASERLAVQSFNWDSMHLYSEVQPETPVGLLGAPAVDDLDEYAAWAEQINPNYRDADAEYIDAIHANGLEIHTYTVDDPAAMAQLLDDGVDGIITNKPDVLNDLLAERNAS